MQVMLDNLADATTQRRGRLDLRLAQLRRAVRRRLLLEGLATAALWALALALASFLLDRWLRLGLPLRLGLVAVGMAALAWVLARQVGVPLSRKMPPLLLAAASDRSMNGRTAIAPHVAAVLQLESLLDRRDAPSPALVRRAVDESCRVLDGQAFERRVDPRRTRRAAALLCGVVIVGAALALLGGGTTRLWFARWFLASNERWPQRTYLHVADAVDGRIIVPRGEAYVLRVAAVEDSEVPPNVRVQYEAANGAANAGMMTLYPPNDFRFTFEPLQEPLRVWLRGGDERLGPISIEPRPRPRIEQIDLAAEHPRQGASYIDLAAGESSPALLPGSRAVLTAVANEPLRSVEVRAERGGDPELRMLDERRFQLTWTHEVPVFLSVELTADAHGLRSRPLPISIGVKEDRPPVVQLRCAGVGQMVTPHARLPAEVTATDDYGVAGVRLSVRFEGMTETQAASRPATSSQSLVLYESNPDTAETSVETAHDVDLLETDLTDGAMVYLSALAEDNCYPSSQTARSRTLALRVVPPAELYRQILLRLQARRAEFRKAAELAESMGAVLSDTGAGVGGLVHDHRRVQQAVRQTAAAIEAALLELRLNRLGSVETHDFMQHRVLEPMQALHDDLLAAQQAALAALPAATDAAARAQAAQRQQRIAAGMKSLLAAMAQWDSFVDLLNQLDEVIKLQAGVRESTEELRKRLLKELFDN